MISIILPMFISSLRGKLSYASLNFQKLAHKYNPCQKTGASLLCFGGASPDVADPAPGQVFPAGGRQTSRDADQQESSH